MSKLKITGKELRSLGYPQGPVISIAMNVMEKNYKHHGREEAFDILKAMLESPEDFLKDKKMEKIARELIDMKTPPSDDPGNAVSLNQTGIQFNVFGQEHIEEGAMHQMYQAAKL